jgi:hypothetical protein
MALESGRTRGGIHFRLSIHTWPTGGRRVSSSSAHYVSGRATQRDDRYDAPPLLLALAAPFGHAGRYHSVPSQSITTNNPFGRPSRSHQASSGEWSGRRKKVKCVQAWPCTWVGC